VAARDESNSSASSPIMTAPEIAAYLRIDRTTLYKLIRRGQIPCFRIGKKNYRFSRTEIVEWLASGGSGGLP
jgi:excisionase family DNA binding protein